MIDRVDAHLIVIEKRFPFKALKDLKDALASSKKKIQGDAAGIFATYQLASAPKFSGPIRSRSMPGPWSPKLPRL